MASLMRGSMLRAVGVRAGASPLPMRCTKVAMALAQRRFASTEPITAPEGLTLLNGQREKRPTSPHFTIYQPQLTWHLSIYNRVTGVALSGLLYGASIVFLLHPLYPAIDSAHVIQFAHDLPTWLKGSAKFILAVPFTFHSFNGIRHLLWDVGTGMTIKGVYVGAYTVMAATAISSLYLAFFV